MLGRGTANSLSPERLPLADTWARLSRERTTTANFKPFLLYGFGKLVHTSKHEISPFSYLLIGWSYVFGMILRWDVREPALARFHQDKEDNIKLLLS